jgi:hypothetical protein
MIHDGPKAIVRPGLPGESSRGGCAFATALARFALLVHDPEKLQTFRMKIILQNNEIASASDSI